MFSFVFQWMGRLLPSATPVALGPLQQGQSVLCVDCPARNPPAKKHTEQASIAEMKKEPRCFIAVLIINSGMGA